MYLRKNKIKWQNFHSMNSLLNLSMVVLSLQLLQVVQTHQTLVLCLGLVLLQKKACELGLQVSLILEICFSVHFCCLLDISMWSSCNQLVTWLILHQYHFVAGLFLLSYEPVTCVVVHQVKPWIKTSLAPGSGVVTKYLFQRYAARSYFTIRLFCMTV